MLQHRAVLCECHATLPIRTVREGSCYRFRCTGFVFGHLGLRRKSFYTLWKSKGFLLV